MANDRREFHAVIEIRGQSKRTAIGAVRAAFRADKQYRVTVYEGEDELFFVFGDDEETAVSEADSMMKRLRRRYQ